MAGYLTTEDLSKKLGIKSPLGFVPPPIAPAPAAVNPLTAPAGPAPAQAVASAPVITVVDSSNALPRYDSSTYPQSFPASGAPPAAPRFGQPGYNPLLHGGSSGPPLDLRIKRDLGIKDYRDEGPPTSAQIDDSRKEWWQKPGWKPPEPEDNRNPFEKISDWATKDTYVGQQAASLATLAIDFIPASIRGLRSNIKMMLELVLGETGAKVVGEVSRATPYSWFLGNDKDFDRLLDASGNLRAEAKANLMDAARKQGGMTGAVIAGVSEGIADTILALKTMQALEVGYGQEAVKAGAPWFAKSWSVVKSAAVRAGIMTARTPHDNPKEFAKAYGLSLAYQSTPAISRHFKDTASVIAADIALNSGITATQVKGLIDSALAQAEAEGGAPEQVERNAAIYATISMIQTIGSDIVFGAMTRAFKDAPPPVRDALEQAKAQAAKVGNDLPTAKPMPVPVDDSVRGPETNPVLATPERPVLISNQREEARAEEGVRISAPEEPARVNPLLEPERVAEPAAEAVRPAEPQAEAPRPAEQVAAPEAARAAEPQAAPRAAPEPTLASRYTPEQLAEMKAHQEKMLDTMKGEPREAKAQDAAKPPERMTPEELNATSGFKYDPNLTSEGEYKNGVVVLGPKAMQMTPEGRADVIRHELSHELDTRMNKDDYLRLLDAADRGDLGARVETKTGVTLKSNFTGQYKPSEILVDAYAHLMGPKGGRDHVMTRAPKVAKLAMDIASEKQLPVPVAEWDKLNNSPPPGYTREGDLYVFKGGQKPAEMRPSNFRLTDNYFTDPRLRTNKRWAWRAMGAKEYAKLMSGEKVYGAGARKGQFFSPTPDGARQYGEAQNKYLVEFDGVEATGEGISGTASKSNVVRAWRYTNGEWKPIRIDAAKPEMVPTSARADDAPVSPSSTEPAQEPAPPKPTTPLAKLVADTPQAFRVTSSRGNVHNVKMPDGVTYPIRAESKAEAIAKAQELASRTPEDVIDDSIRMVEEAKSQAEKDAKGGYVDAGDAAMPIANAMRGARESFMGVMRSFGEQYVSDKPLMHKLEETFHNRAAAVEMGISDIDKVLKDAGPRSLENSVAVAIAIEEGIPRDALPESARRLYDLAKQAMDDITALEKDNGVLNKEFPESARDAINEKIAEIQAKTSKKKSDLVQLGKLQDDLLALEKFAKYIPHGIVARRVMQKLFEESNGRQRKDIGNRLEQNHHRRMGRNTLREYFEAGIIRAEDMDIGKLMMSATVSAYQKIAVKSLVDYGIEGKYIQFGKTAPGNPKEWFDLSQLARSAQVFKVTPPAGQKVWVQRLFGLGLEELAGSQTQPGTAFDKLLVMAKVGQFYKPTIIWTYNYLQRYYGGATEFNPIKNFKNTSDAWKAVMMQNEDYHTAARLGIFQAPDNIPRQSIDKQIEIASRQTRNDIARGGVIGNQLKKIMERATGEVFTAKAWAEKGMSLPLDGLMTPIRAFGMATWTGDKVQRMHTFYNLTRRGMSPQDAAEQTARMHGAYSKIGKEYRNVTRRLLFVHSFRILMPLQTARAYYTPFKLAAMKFTGKEIPQREVHRAVMGLLGTVIFPTLLDTALRYNGWTPTEEEEEFFSRKGLRWTRIKVGDKYQITLALPNWKYKKDFVRDGENRRVYRAFNTIVNMPTKWFIRGMRRLDNIGGVKDWSAWTLMKWELNPLYRIIADLWDNESSFGEVDPMGPTGNDVVAGFGYVFRNMFRLYGDAWNWMKAEEESSVYKEAQLSELKEVMTTAERAFTEIAGYAYTSRGREERANTMITSLRRSAAHARSKQERHYKGEHREKTRETAIQKIDEAEAKMEKHIRRRYNVPRPPAEIVRIITDPGLADNPSKQANAARLVKYGMDGMTAKDLRTALVKEAREQGWNTKIRNSNGELTAYGQRKLRLSRFIRKHNIE